ncbi:GntR family transcriptional regulator [Leptolyngbya sp. AN02str]|uniref:GntR family transcriptional regulator n=1 Tax=Leptolyngbya sp. AN02str TaxID=3423363 RepID=UPI003D313DCE
MTAKLPLTPVKGLTRTTQATVTEYLRQAILSGELAPGTRLVQAELAEALNVSVTPIREALRELSTGGLIDLDAFRGAVVHTPTIHELEDIFEIRAELLPLNIRQGIHQLTKNDLDAAAKLLDCMEAETSPTNWLALNRQFHGMLYRAHPNVRLQTLLQQLSDFADLYINLSFSGNPMQRESSDREHRELLDAYRQRDVERAIAIAVSHITSTLEAARNVLSHG